MATTLTFHQTALRPVIAGLKNAKAFLTKAQEHAASQGIDPNDYLTASLHPDMYNFTRQVQLFTDTAKFLPVRVNSSNPAITLEDVEKTFPELLDRVQRTIDYVEGIDPKSFEGREDAEVVMLVKNGAFQMTYSVSEYIALFAHPNFWFHSTTAYDILRSKGVPLGKGDFLNGAKLKEYKIVEKK